MILKYKKFMLNQYLLSFTKVTLVFSSIIIVMNLFEEVSFFKNQEKFLIPLILTFVNLPSLLFEIFPFIFFLSSIFFYSNLIEKNELNIFRLNGITNFKILFYLSQINFLIGVLIILIFYNLSSNLKHFYLEIKNQYSSDGKYLAVITANGLWIRDIIDNKINYINAEKLAQNNIKNVTITEFDKDFNLVNILQAEQAEIKTKIWKLKNVVINSNNEINKIDYLDFNSNFDNDKILSIFNNFSALSLKELQTLKKDYELIGYDTSQLESYKYKLYSFPVNAVLMVSIASILMLKLKHNKSKLQNISLGIIISVIIYYINYFISAFSEINEISMIISVWGTQIILLSIVGLSLIILND